MMSLWDRILLANEEKRRFMIAESRGKKYGSAEFKEIKKAATVDPEAAILTVESD